MSYRNVTLHNFEIYLDMFLERENPKYGGDYEMIGTAIYDVLGPDVFPTDELYSNLLDKIMDKAVATSKWNETDFENFLSDSEEYYEIVRTIENLVDRYIYETAKEILKEEKKED